MAKERGENKDSCRGGNNQRHEVDDEREIKALEK